MRYTIPVGLMLLCMIIFQNCGKDLKGAAPINIPIEDYISQNNINPAYTASGLGYVIGTAGSARRAVDASTVKTDIVVKTTDNTARIDTQGDVYLNLFDQVSGLKEGLQLVGDGGTITLYVPYEIAWGSTGNASVPEASDVIITISIVDILIDVETYIEERNLTLSDTTASGAFVIIEEEGDGSFPDITNTVNIKYSGYYTNGDVFDSNDEGLVIALGSLIKGWQEGIPLFSKGGKGKLFVPYEIGYGISGSQSIQGRTDLIFDIELVDFN